jgi:hypothetical protein
MFSLAMEALFPFLIVGAVMAVVALGIATHFVVERKRTEAIGRVAGELGLSFHPKGLPLLISQLSTYPLFSKGRAQKAANVIQGTTGDMEVTILDYQYTTGSGKHAHTWKQTVVCFKSDALALPSFELRPESLFDRLGAAFGGQDIDFEQYPAFSKKYVLRGTDEAQVRKVFTHEALRWLEAQPALCLEARGDRLLMYRASKRVKPDDIRAFLKEGFQAFALFKRDCAD